MTSELFGLVILLILIGVGVMIVWSISRKPEERVTPDGYLTSDVATWRRLVNFIVDTFFILLIAYILTPILLIGSYEGPRLGPTFIITFVYYFIFEAALQKTPGKFVTRTKVESSKILNFNESTKPSTSAIAWRTLTRFVPFEPLSGWWHDRWSETRVMMEEKDSA